MMIESVGLDQARLLAELHAAAFDSPWNEAEIAKLMASPTVFALWARGAEPEGFVMAWAAGGDAEILTLAVTPLARRKGVGAALMHAAGAAAAMRGAAAMHLEVAVTNAPARELYAKLGFIEAGRRKCYYSNPDGGVDALVLRWNLPR